MICHIELANTKSLHKDIYMGELFYILVLFFYNATFLQIFS